MTGYEFTLALVEALRWPVVALFLLAVVQDWRHR